jgi:hypothetical protein
MLCKWHLANSKINKVLFIAFLTNSPVLVGIRHVHPKLDYNTGQKKVGALT